MGVCISSWWSGRSSKLCGLLVDQRRVDRVVGSGGFFLRLLLFYIFFLASVVCVGDASLDIFSLLENSAM
jgi:hypothetical protein